MRTLRSAERAEGEESLRMCDVFQILRPIRCAQGFGSLAPQNDTVSKALCFRRNDTSIVMIRWWAVAHDGLFHISLYYSL